MKGCVLLSILSSSYAVKVAKTSHHDMLASFSETALDPDAADPEVGSVMQSVSGHVDLASALNAVQHKELPSSVVHMVQSASNASAFASYDDNSLEKARRALNDLIEKAWVELDTKILKCKGFAEMNREHFAQVNRDIARLVEQISDMERVESQSTDGGTQADEDIAKTQGILDEEQAAYEREFNTNDAELKI